MPTLTAAQRQTAAREDYDAFRACPSRLVLARISDKWVTLILVALARAAAVQRPAQDHRGRQPEDAYPDSPRAGTGRPGLPHRHGSRPGEGGL